VGKGKEEDLSKIWNWIGWSYLFNISCNGKNKQIKIFTVSFCG